MGCPDVTIESGGYYGMTTGYCESYTFNPGLGHPWNLCLLVYSQCQEKPMQHKPAYHYRCEEEQKFTIPKDEPNALVAGKSFDAGEKICCTSEVRSLPRLSHTEHSLAQINGAIALSLTHSTNLRSAWLREAPRLRSVIRCHPCF